MGEEKRPSKPGDKKLQCVVVTPEKTLFDELVDFVALPLYDGELGVLPGRAPLIGRLGFGELRTRTDDVVHRYFVDGGFAQVRDDVVTVLTQRAIPAEQLDATAAARELEVIDNQRVVTDLEYADHVKAVARARGMIRVATPKRLGRGRFILRSGSQREEIACAMKQFVLPGFTRPGMMVHGHVALFEQDFQEARQPVARPVLAAGGAGVQAELVRDRVGLIGPDGVNVAAAEQVGADRAEPPADLRGVDQRLSRELTLMFGRGRHGIMAGDHQPRDCSGVRHHLLSTESTGLAGSFPRAEMPARVGSRPRIAVPSSSIRSHGYGPAGEKSPKYSSKRRERWARNV